MATQYAFGQIVTSGLVLCLNAADKNSYPGTGTTWTDLSGNSNNGTLTNGPTFNSGNGGSIVFDGVDDYVNLSQSSLYQFSNTSPFTISTWVNANNIGDFNNIFAYSLGSGNYRGYYIALINSADVFGTGLRTNSFLFDYFDGNEYRGLVGNNNSITFNSWVMITATSANNSASGMAVYQNASIVPYQIRRDGNPNSINYTGVPVRIGIRDTIQPFKGNISNTLVYNRVLSSTEILQNYNATKTRFGL